MMFGHTTRIKTSATLLQDGTFHWNYYSRVSHGQLLVINIYDFPLHNYGLVLQFGA